MNLYMVTNINYPINLLLNYANIFGKIVILLCTRIFYNILIEGKGYGYPSLLV